MLNCAMLLVEVPIARPFLDNILVTNKGIISRQRVQFKWKPLKCNHCEMFGHVEEDCRKKKKVTHVEEAKDEGN